MRQSRYLNGRAGIRVNAELTENMYRCQILCGLEPGLDVHDRLPSALLVEQAAQLYGNGSSLQQVADHVSIPKSAVRKALMDSGVLLREPRRH
jgi:hypothetical protein